MTSRLFGIEADHAYWLSWMRLAEPTLDPPIGRIDVVSEGFGVGDAPAGPTQTGAGALTGSTIPAVPYTTQSRDWGTVPSAPVGDAPDITARNVAAVTVDVARARVDCNARLDVHTDSPLAVTLAGCGRTQRFGP
jgi:hypothetical protein